jgi:hypothetical protein
MHLDMLDAPGYRLRPKLNVIASDIFLDGRADNMRKFLSATENPR